MDKGTRAELIMRKANLKKESVCEYCGGKGCDKCEKKELKKESLSFKQFMEKAQVEEGLKAARDNVGASKCWKGYKAKGTKMKGGKEVPNCVPEEVHQAMADQMIEEGYRRGCIPLLSGEKKDSMSSLKKMDSVEESEELDEKGSKKQLSLVIRNTRKSMVKFVVKRSHAPRGDKVERTLKSGAKNVRGESGGIFRLPRR